MVSERFQYKQNGSTWLGWSCIMLHYIVQAHPEGTHFQTPAGHFDTNLPHHLGSLLVSGVRGEMQKGSALHFVCGPGAIWICGGDWNMLSSLQSCQISKHSTRKTWQGEMKPCFCMSTRWHSEDVWRCVKTCLDIVDDSNGKDSREQTCCYASGQGASAALFVPGADSGADGGS